MKTVYDELKDIHYLLDYKPDESNCGLYDTNVILLCHKITDVYVTLCIARSNIHYVDNDDYGDFARDEISKLYVNSMLVQNSLVYYNFAVDLSWQVGWLYADQGINGLMPTSQLYERESKKCDFETLCYNLTLAQDIKLREHYRSLYNNSFFKKLREDYNFIKHRGTFHYKGLGLNDSKMMIRVNDYMLPLVSRREIDINEMRKKLIEFDKLFTNYFLDIVNMVVPGDYLTNKHLLNSSINFYFNYKEQIEKDA